MTKDEIARAIRAETIKAEAALAEIDRLATDEFRAGLDQPLAAKAIAAHGRAVKAVGAMHRAMDKAGKASGVKFGK